MNPAGQALQTQTVPKNNEVEYVPFGSEDKVKLSTSIIKTYVAIPTKSGKLPDDRECIRFMMLCRSRKLNPFEGDCFLQGYDGKDGPEFSLITAHQAFLKRAEVHPEFDGMDSGVIVLPADSDVPTEREGDFLHADDQLIGGWAIVYFKKRGHPMKRRLNLRTFIKPYGRWATDPAGMIVKCAEADALRSSFPTMLGGLYADVERGPVIDVGPGAKAPDFGPEPGKLPAPAKPAAPHTPPPAGAAGAPGGAQTKTEPEKQPGTPPAASESAPAGETSAPQAPAENFVPNTAETEACQNLRFLMSKSGVSEPQVLSYAKENGMGDKAKLTELSDAKLLSLGKAWNNILPKLKAYPIA